MTENYSQGSIYNLDPSTKKPFSGVPAVVKTIPVKNQPVTYSDQYSSMTAGLKVQNSDQTEFVFYYINNSSSGWPIW